MFRLIWELRDVPENARGNSRMEICAIPNLDVAAKRYTCIGCDGICRTKALQLDGEYTRKSPRALCKKFVHVGCGRLKGFNDDEYHDAD